MLLTQWIGSAWRKVCGTVSLPVSECLLSRWFQCSFHERCASGDESSTIRTLQLADLAWWWDRAVWRSLFLWRAVLEVCKGSYVRIMCFTFLQWFWGFDAHLWKEVFCDAIILKTCFCMGCSRYRVDHLTIFILEFLTDVFGTPNHCQQNQVLKNHSKRPDLVDFENVEPKLLAVKLQLPNCGPDVVTNVANCPNI